MRLKRVKAGVLLYSLLIASIFTLLIQFYMHRVIASERQHQAHITQNHARLVAELTKELAHEKTGQLTFNAGKSNYEINGNQLLVTVQIDSDQYQFHFLHHQGNKEKEKLDKNGTEETHSISDRDFDLRAEIGVTEKANDLKEQTEETTDIKDNQD
ncbi:competence type IV pilus minor pilin ComGG [Streptococcus fryi]